MTNIIEILVWKFKNLPRITTLGDNLIKFPPDVEGVDYEERGVALPVADGAEPVYETRSLPTKTNETSWRAEYEEHLSSIQYQSDRKTDYPPLEEQLDMMYHDKVEGTNKWFEAIRAVKERYPKPVSDL